MLDFNHLMTTPGYNVQVFLGNNAGTTVTAWQTWIKPRGINWVYMIGAGAGGGGGCGFAAPTAAAGGGGGGSGAQSSVSLPAYLIPDVLYISTGQGGNGGTGSGVNGTTGTNTIVSIEPSPITSTGTVFLFANAGSGGSGVKTQATAGPAGVAGAVTTIVAMPMAARGSYNFLAGQAGTAGGASQTAGAALTLPVTGLMVTGGTGGGGSDATAAPQFAGGAITGVGLNATFPTVGGGRAGTATVIGDGGSGGLVIKPFPMNNTVGMFHYGGTGSGGDAFAVGRISGPGGRGAPGCGGGGSGAGAAAGVGVGGPGGPGFVIIISW